MCCPNRVIFLKNVSIIGGGASGIALAVMLKFADPKIDVTVFEARDRILKKLLVTGNGQCNITNRDFSARRYHGADPRFAENLIGKFPPDKQAEFFKKIGVDIVFEKDGRAYPSSYQASSVVDCLRFSAEEHGVNTVNGRIEAIKRLPDGFLLSVDGKKLHAENVVVATGGSAGGNLGDGSGYALLKSLGHKITEPKPAITQITTLGGAKSLKGIKSFGCAKAMLDDRVLRSETGEILFCDYGLSGPPILQLSRAVSQCGEVKISLDFMPNVEYDALVSEFRQRKDMICLRPATEFFTGLLNKRLGQYIVRAAGVSSKKKCGDLNRNETAAIARFTKSLDFTATGTTGLKNAQVTAGGADVAQFFPDTLMSKKAPGLYAVGEVLDVDGDCGGFNLSFCWASAAAVAAALICGEDNR